MPLTPRQVANNKKSLAAYKRRMMQHAEEARAQGVTRAEFLGRLVPGVHSQEETEWLWGATADLWEGRRSGLRKNPPVAIFANPGRSVGRGKEKITLDESIGSETAALNMIANNLTMIRNAVRRGDGPEAILHSVQVAESWLRGMQQDVSRGIHRNPGRIPLTGRDRGRLGGSKMSERVIAVEYKHKDDGKAYRHDFSSGVQMIAEADGNLRLQHHDPGTSLWEDM